MKRARRGGKEVPVTAGDHAEADLRAYLDTMFDDAPRSAFALLEREGIGHASVLSAAGLAAIAFTDAVTISADGSGVNRKDHSIAAALLRDFAGRNLPDTRLADSRSLLSMKDKCQRPMKATLPIIVMARLVRATWTSTVPR